MTEQFEWRRYLVALRRWLWLVILGTAAAAGTAYLVSSNTTPVYSASTTLLVQQASAGGASDYQDVLMSQRLALTYSKMVNGIPVLESAITELGLSTTPEELADRTDVQLEGDTLLIHLVVEDTDAARAARVANSISDSFISLNQSLQQERYAESISNLAQQINDMSLLIDQTRMTVEALEDSESPQQQAESIRLQTILAGHLNTYATLVQNYEQLRLTAAQSSDNVTVFAPARVPENPVRPRTKTNTALAAVVGAMAMVGIVFLVEYLDDTVKSPDDVKRSMVAGVLGMIPKLNDGDRQLALVTALEPRQPVAEAFRNLRTSIQYARVDKPVKVLLITSPVPADGKSFIAANLAISLAQAGNSVVLIDADLRKPVQHRLFDLPNRIGLTSVILNLEGSRSALQHTSVSGLQVLPSGPHVPNPTELLASNKVRQFIGLLGSKVDVVIIDSPPVLAFADAAVLSTLADGAMLVVGCGTTRRTAAAQAGERITSVGAKLLGVVLNRIGPDNDGYHVYYGYYHYGEKDGRVQE